MAVLWRWWTKTGSTNADVLDRAAACEEISARYWWPSTRRPVAAGTVEVGRRPPCSQLALSVGVGAADVPADLCGWLPLATGVAVVDALAEATGETADLKWPNDVLVGEGKLAGTLAEVPHPSPAIVVGLGPTVTMTAAEARIRPSLRWGCWVVNP